MNSYIELEEQTKQLSSLPLFYTNPWPSLSLTLPLPFTWLNDTQVVLLSCKPLGKGYLVWDDSVTYDESGNYYGMIRVCYLVHRPKRLWCRGRHKEVTRTGGCHMILVIKTSSTNAKLWKGWGMMWGTNQPPQAKKNGQTLAHQSC